MRYFAIFKTRYGFKKALLYKSLLDKRLGKGTYTIHRDSPIKLLYNSANDDYFSGGTLIEFNDIKTLALFKLCHRSVINPSVDGKHVILRSYSFSTEDNIVEVINDLHRKISYLNKAKERFIADNNYIAAIKEVLKGKENKITLKIPDDLYSFCEENDDLHKEIYNKLNEVLKNYDAKRISMYRPDENEKIKIYEENVENLKMEILSQFKNILDLDSL